MEHEVLLDLTLPRTIVLTDRGQTFTLECRRVTDIDWTAYFNGITHTSEQQGKERISVFDETTARLALVDSVLTGASGYTVEGGADLMSLPNWQRRIPLAHRLKLGEVLGDCTASQSVGLVIHAEGEVVLLDCTWTSVAKDKGFAMQRYEGLKHILQTPTEDRYRRYKRESTRSVVQGGSRSGRTVYRNPGPMLAKLYDELVVDVEGYASMGEPLHGQNAIRTQMDMLHKVTAALNVLSPNDSTMLASEEDSE